MHQIIAEFFFFLFFWLFIFVLLFSQEGEVTSSLIRGPACSLRLQFTKYQQRYAPMNFFFIFFLLFHLQFISGALNYTGASFCATSFNLPWAYNAPLGGALVQVI